MKTKVRVFIGWIFLHVYFLHLVAYIALHCSWYIVEPYQLNFPLTILEKKKKSQTTFFGCCCINSEYPSNIQLHKTHCKTIPWKCFRSTWSHALFWPLWYVGYQLLIPCLSWDIFVVAHLAYIKTFLKPQKRMGKEFSTKSQYNWLAFALYIFPYT